MLRKRDPTAHIDENQNPPKLPPHTDVDRLNDDLVRYFGKIMKYETSVITRYCKVYSSQLKGLSDSEFPFKLFDTGLLVSSRFKRLLKKSRYVF